MIQNWNEKSNLRYQVIAIALFTLLICLLNKRKAKSLVPCFLLVFQFLLIYFRSLLVPRVPFVLSELSICWSELIAYRSVHTPPLSSEQKNSCFLIPCSLLVFPFLLMSFRSLLVQGVPFVLSEFSPCWSELI